MKREQVLTALLVISLCANAYLIFFNHSSLDQRVKIMLNPVFHPVHANENSSNPEWYENTSIFEKTPSGTAIEVPETQTDVSSVSQEPTEEVVNLTPEPTPEITAEPTPETPQEPAPEQTPATTAWNNFTSAEAKFSLRYPATWNISERSTSPSGRVLVLTAPIERECPEESTQCYEYSATLTVVIDPTPGTPNPEDYFTSAVAALQDKYSITSTSKSASCMLSGLRAYQIEFYSRDERGNPDRSYMQYYGIFDGRAFIISYAGPYSTGENVYSHNKGDAQRIIDSFEVERTYLEV
jgi:hypothetical protein